MGLTIGIVSARWNAALIDRLRSGVDRGLAAVGVTETVEVSVPGSFEIPMAAAALARRGDVDAIVTIGAVIRGETTHYELVSEGCATGLARVQLDLGIPIAFGLLTVENLDQALARSQDAGGHNIGEEAALVAVEMARLLETLGQ